MSFEDAPEANLSYSGFYWTLDLGQNAELRISFRCSPIPKFAFPPEEIEALLAMLQSKGEIFRPEEFPAVSPDPADTKFLHCAQEARAEFIITGNKRDFPDGPYGSTRVVSAGELLSLRALGPICNRSIFT